MAERLRAALPSLISLVLFLVAAVVLRAELHALTWQQLTSDLARIPHQSLALALALTALNYAALTGYDFLAFAYLGKWLPWQRIVLTSFVAYAVSNNVGLSLIAGMSVRYRFYTRWGITFEELTRAAFSYVVTYWVGWLLIGGYSLTTGSLTQAIPQLAPALATVIGWLLMLTSVAYVAAAALRLGPIRIRRLTLTLPRARLALAQLGVSLVEWILAGGVLYVLLPAGSVAFVTLLGAFLAAHLLGSVSHVPGGLGVFDGALVLLLAPFVPSSTLFPTLIAYRIVYYLLPLTVAAAAVVEDELRQRRLQAARIGAALDWLAAQLTPSVLAVLAFLAGSVLLVSGVTPAATGRLGLLGQLLPLGLIELSHFAGSVVGAALLLLSQGLARRLDAAYFLTAIAMMIGIATSLLKAADYEEASVLAVVLLLLWRARSIFDRRAALFDTHFSARWILAVSAIVIGSLWLGFFAFKHVEFSNELWWQFELHGEASRMLRASVGASLTIVLFAFARLIGHAPHAAPRPTEADLNDAAAIITKQTTTFPYLVLLRDKSILFDDQRSSFLMYGVRGRTWAALGDPVGPRDRISTLVRLFLERSNDFGGVPVFYEVSSRHLHQYADVGLALVKLGEEARVDLGTFSLEGSRGAKYRQAMRRLEREHATFRVLSGEDVRAVMGQLRAVSDAWLSHHAGGEKGFSLGFFDAWYIERFPVAVIERDGRIVAFANLWPGPDQDELSTDLMRYDEGAPNQVMDGLFVHLMLWGKEQQYRWFSLGMAPLSGVERSPTAPLWNSLASFLYDHGEAVYRFRGLRAFKQKFEPVWVPHYLAYPGGLRLPRALADVSALIAGGYRRIVFK